MKNVKFFFDGFFAGFKEPGHLINSIVTFVLLFIVFVFGIGLVAISSKIFKKTHLDVRIKKRASTYWIDSKIKDKTKEDYYKPF